MGLVVEVVISAIEEAALADARAIDGKSFARAFRRRSGCVDALNPFLSDDWRAINARLLLQRPDGPGEPLAEEGRRSRPCPSRCPSARPRRRPPTPPASWP